MEADGDTGSSSRMESLPDEILLLIFEHLGTNDVIFAGLVCRSWQRVADDGTLWKGFCEKAWPLISNDRRNALMYAGPTYHNTDSILHPLEVMKRDKNKGNSAMSWKEYYMRMTQGVDISLTWAEYFRSWWKDFISSGGKMSSTNGDYRSKKVLWQGWVVSPPEEIRIGDQGDDSPRKIIRTIVRMPSAGPLTGVCGGRDVALWCRAVKHPKEIYDEVVTYHNRTGRPLNKNRIDYKAFDLTKKMEALTMGDEIYFTGRLHQRKQRLGASLVSPWVQPMQCYHSVAASKVNLWSKIDMNNFYYAIVPYLLLFLFLPLVLWRASTLTSGSIYPLAVRILLALLWIILAVGLSMRQTFHRSLGSLAGLIHAMIVLCVSVLCFFRLEEFFTNNLIDGLSVYAWLYSLAALIRFSRTVSHPGPQNNTIRKWAKVKRKGHIPIEPTPSQKRKAKEAERKELQERELQISSDIVVLVATKLVIIVIACACSSSFFQFLYNRSLMLLQFIAELFPLLLAQPVYHLQSLLPSLPMRIVQGIKTVANIALLSYGGFYVYTYYKPLCCLAWLLYCLYALGMKQTFVDSCCYMMELNRKLLTTILTTFIFIVETVSDFLMYRVLRRKQGPVSVAPKKPKEKIKREKAGRPIGSRLDKAATRKDPPKFNKGGKGGKRTFR